MKQRGVRGRLVDFDEEGELSIYFFVGNSLPFIDKTWPPCRDTACVKGV
jgi:hypothetical protein